MESLGITASSFECLLGLSPRRTVSEALRILSDPNTPGGTQIDRVSPFLESNQAYAHLLQKLDILQRMKSDWTGLDQETAPGQGAQIQEGLKRCLRLLGPTGVRNSLLCLSTQLSAGTGVPRKEGEPLSLDIPSRLKYSLEIEELWQDKNWPSPYQAFLGGLHFDLIAAHFAKDRKTPSSLKNYLQSTWTTSVAIARRAQILGSLFRDFKFQQAAVPATLLLGVGRVLMAINFPQGTGAPAWVDFEKDLAKPQKDGSRLSHVQALIAERRRFSITHNECAALIAGFSGFFTPIVRALLHAQEPYLLKGVDPDLYALAAILSISQEVGTKEAREITKLTPASGRLLAQFRLNEEEVLKQLRKAQPQ